MTRMLAHRKTLLSFSFATLLLAAACAQNQKLASETNANKSAFSTTPPFQTEEPERYRATRTTTIIKAAGETVTIKGLLARDGEKRRNETETAGQRVVYLTLPEGTFVLLPDKKIFAAAVPDDTNAGGQESETAPDRLLHTEMITTGYEQLGPETMGGRSLQKYRVVVNNSTGENVSAGETFLWFDETVHLPVRTESRSPDGTRAIMELSDVVLRVDKTLFDIPKDYEKIEFAKLREQLGNSQP